MARVTLTGDVLGDDEPPPRPAAATPPPPPPKPPRRKFTMLVEDEDDERARRVVDDVLRLGRIRPTKSMRADVVRVLFALADEDPQLRAAVAARLHDIMPS